MQIKYLILTTIPASIGLGLASAENRYWWIPVLVGALVLFAGLRQERLAGRREKQ